jgi:hypothetical protein
MALRSARTRSKKFRPQLVGPLREAVQQRRYRIDVGAIADALAERAKGALAAVRDLLLEDEHFSEAGEISGPKNEA